MADDAGVVDKLVIATEFDETGLDRSTASALNRIQRFAGGVGQAVKSIPAIDLNSDPATSKLANLGVQFNRFVAEVRDLEAFPDFTTDRAQKEIAELLAEFPGLEKALEAIDPSGVFRVMGRSARDAAIEIQKTVEVQRQAAVEISRTVAGAGVRGSTTDPAAVAGAQRLSQAEQQLAAQITQTRIASTLAAQRINEMSAAEALAGIAALKAGGQIQVQTRGIITAKQQEAQAHRLAAAAAQAGVASATALTAGYIAQTQAARALAAANLEAARSVDAVAAGMSRATSGSLAWGQGAAIINEQHRGIAASGVPAGKGIERVRAGLTGLALSASGASPAIGQVVSGLLLLGGGSIAVLGAAAGIAVVAGAIALIEGPARRAREETDELIASLKAAERGRLPAFQQTALDLLNIQSQADEARSRIARLQELASAQGRGGALLFPELPKEIERLKELERQLGVLNRLEVKLRLEEGDALIRDLIIQKDTFGLTASEARRYAISLANLTPEQRIYANAVNETIIRLERQREAAAGASEEIKRSADEILRAFRATQSMAGLSQVLTLTANTSGLTSQIAEAERQLASLRSQGTRITISGDATTLLREITTVEGRLAGLRAQRGAVQVTGDTSALTAEITEAEAQLDRLLSQSATRITLTGDADPALREIAAVEARLASLRAERAQIGLSADTSGLTTQITDAERSLERLLRQRGAIAITGDAAPLLGEIAEVEARLAQLRSERAAVTLSADTANLNGPIAEAEAQLARLREQGATLALDADPTAILREMETVQARLAQLRGQAALLELTGPDTSPLTLELGRVDAELARLKASGREATEEFRRMAAQRTGLVEKQQEARALIAEFSKIGQKPFELKFETKLTLEDPDKAIGQILAELQKRALDRPFVLTLKPIQIPVEVDSSLLGDAEAGIEGLNDALLEQNPIWREANAQAEKLNRKLRDSRTNADRFADSLLAASEIMGSFADFGADVGFLKEEDLRGIQAFQDAAKSVASFASGDLVGGITAALSTLGGIFGGGETEHDRIVRENTEAIHRNTQARSEAFEGLGGADELAQAIGRVIGENLAAVDFASSDIGQIRGLGSAMLEQEFAELSISLEDLQRVAEMHGLDVLDEKGRIVGEALDQLRREILADIDAQLRFRQTLDNLINVGDLRARITGEGIDAETSFQREIDAAAALGGTAIQQALSGLDVGDTEAVRKAFLGLVDAWEDGTIVGKDLGKLSIDDFKRLLEDGAGFLDTFNQEVVDAAAELNIIPKGFRNAALAFEAQIPTLIPPRTARAVDIPLVNLAVEPADALDRLIPQPILITGQELLDRLVTIGAIPATTVLPATVPGDGAALPQIAASLGSSTSALAQIAASLGAIQAQPATQAQADTAAAITRLMEMLAKARFGMTVQGDLIVQPPPVEGLSPRENALEFRRTLEDIAMADYGRTDKWGQT